MATDLQTNDTLVRRCPGPPVESSDRTNRTRVDRVFAYVAQRLHHVAHWTAPATDHDVDPMYDLP